MAKFKLISILLIVILFSGCVVIQKTEREPWGSIDYVDVFQQAADIMNTIASESIDPGDNVLIIPYSLNVNSQFNRFIPVHDTISKNDYLWILQELKNTFRGSTVQTAESPEEKFFKKCFKSNIEDGSYSLDFKNGEYDPVELGRLLGLVKFSSLENFEISTIINEYPYFFEYLENGFISSINLAGAYGKERLSIIPRDNEARSAIAEGSMIFNTNTLKYNSLEELKNEHSDIDKMVLYSVSRVNMTEDNLFGMSLHFKILDVNKGRIIWEGTRNSCSEGYPDSDMSSIRKIDCTFPEDIFEAGTEKNSRLNDEPIDVVLVKCDDIPVFGNYSIFEEDYFVEEGLAHYLSGIGNVSVLEKMSKRNYKKNWQLVNSIFYTNAFLGGNYTEFENYYGTPYMVAYRVLWKNQTGINRLDGDKTFNLYDQLAGIYFKVIDMNRNGQIIMSDFIPFASEEELNSNILYKCFNVTNSLDQEISNLKREGGIRSTDSISLINRRMEILNHYQSQGSAAEGFITEKALDIGDDDLFELYTRIYKKFDSFREEKTEDVSPEGDGQMSDLSLNSSALTNTSSSTEEDVQCDKTEEMEYIIVANLMHSWFEDGLSNACVRNGIRVNEKLESIYSRYLISKESSDYQPVDNTFLSPLLLKQWGGVIENYYNINKVIYYLPYENSLSKDSFIQLTGTCDATKFLPILTDQLDWILFSVLNLNTGEYSLNENIPIQ